MEPVEPPRGADGLDRARVVHGRVRGRSPHNVGTRSVERDTPSDPSDRRVGDPTRRSTRFTVTPGTTACADEHARAWVRPALRLERHPRDLGGEAEWVTRRVEEHSPPVGRGLERRDPRSQPLGHVPLTDRRPHPPATPIRLPSGSVKWPTTRSLPGFLLGPITRLPPSRSAACSAASTSGTPT
jgi:hypothetical protein